jgi:gamma-glutamyltranspeptidase/glutathione hydrolase
MTASTTFAAFQHPTYKPMLMGKEWVAVTGEPLSATAGARMFMKGGNAVDAAAAMLAAVCVLNDSLSFGGENQALIYDPNRHKVFAINGLGVAPAGATPEYFTRRGMKFPPAFDRWRR